MLCFAPSLFTLLNLPLRDYFLKNMRFTFCFFLLLSLGLQAQNQEAYQFKTVKSTESTPVKSQDQTGTCWAFSTASFLEGELLRTGKGTFDLSEMFIVRHIYRQKCENYVRRQGKAQFGEGGLAHDLLNAVAQYGITTETAYPGRKDLKKPHNHAAIEAGLKKFCDGLLEQATQNRLSSRWTEQVDSLLDESFGKVPVTFEVNGTRFSPVSFRDFLGIHPENYVHLTSFMHHPYYQSFILEIPDNWANGSFFNLPLDELMRCLNFSLHKGYGVEWDADVSNRGFSAQNGLAIVPEKDWKDKNNTAQAATFKYWEAEKYITPQYRQEQFDRLIVQDDHLMHITGLLDETHSGLFYTVKNSWGEISDFKGYVNTSEAYMRLNTISFTIHKDALPPDILKRMGIEAGEVNVEQGAVPSSGGRKKPAGKATEEPAFQPARTTNGRTLTPIGEKRKLPTDKGDQ
jgi:bleomycin hydrolase